MNRQRRFRSIAVGIAVTLLLLTACTPSGGTPTASSASKVLNVGLLIEPDTIDPHISNSVGFVPIENAYETLVYTDGASTKLKPVLAESWTVSPDNLVYTFHIRHNVKFADGTLLDANAVKASIDRIKALNKGPAYLVADVTKMDVKAPDVLEITVKPGGLPFLAGLAKVYIASPKAITEQAKDNDLAKDYFNRVSDGTGPYQIMSWEHGQKVVLKKFNDYWGGWSDPNHFTDVNLLVIPEAATQQQMLVKGDLDLAFNFPVEAIPAFEKDPNLQVQKAESVRILGFMANPLAPPTNDRRVRQAFNYAFDFASFQTAMLNTYDPPVGPVPLAFLPGKPSYPYKYDLEKAKSLLRDAGYTETKKAKIVIDIPTGVRDTQKSSEILQAGLRATGLVDAEIRPGDFFAESKSLLDWQKTKDPATAHHLFALGTPARLPDPYAYLWYVYDTKAGGGFANNFTGYSNAAFDGLMDRAGSTADLKARGDLDLQATQLLIDDAAAVWVGGTPRIYALRKDIAGFFVHPSLFPHVLVYNLTRR